MISIVCIYNNKEILNKYLLKSLRTQTVKFEPIFIDNTDNKFKSATEALNYGGNKANGKYLMFVHQDVFLFSDEWLDKIEKSLNSLKHFGVAGVAGVSEKGKDVISNIKHGISHKKAGKIHIKNPFRVQTLDECLFIIPQNVFKTYKFDENLNGWHLYAVDYCLNVNRNGLKVYVLPYFIYHMSHGYSMSEDFYSKLKYVLKKYKKDYDTIYTTCDVWNTSHPIIVQRIVNKITNSYRSIFRL